MNRIHVYIGDIAKVGFETNFIGLALRDTFLYDTFNETLLLTIYEEIGDIDKQD